MRQVFINNGALERTFLRLREDLKRVGHRGLAPVIGARSLAVVFSRPRTFLMTFCSQVASVVSGTFLFKLGLPRFTTEVVF